MSLNQDKFCPVTRILKLDSFTVARHFQAIKLYQEHEQSHTIQIKLGAYTTFEVRSGANVA